MDPFWQLLPCKKVVAVTQTLRISRSVILAQVSFYTQACPVRPNHKPFGPDQPVETGPGRLWGHTSIGYAPLFIHIFIWQSLSTLKAHLENMDVENGGMMHLLRQGMTLR